ncbi:MAG: CMP/dCMP kinase [Solirubrobacteraceae bacterium]|nr:CMP/dCMP kinase [Solirubrobacteraceae bacterium]
MLVAIDGPAGAGKSTVARAAARALGFPYLDTGAMYRCVALAGARDPATLDIAFRDGRVLLDGEDVSEAIRRPEISQEASRRATEPAVRAAMRDKQRALIAGGDWVAEGRDIGTVVAPDAELKVWLTADEDERARRRGEPVADVRERDVRDAGREHSPMVAAPDAVEVDTTGRSVDEVVDRIVELVGARSAAGGRR